jgi:5'(3')-deoxyribonucleotidase
MKTLFIDMDGVLVDTVVGFCELHKKSNPYLKTKNLGIYNLCKIWNMELSVFWKNCGYDFWLGLGIDHKARGLLSLAEQLFGENVFFCTSPCKTQGCLEGKRAWVNRHFPEYIDRVIFTKHKYLLSKQGTILLDDYDKNCEEFIRLGSGIAILYPRLWNSDFALNKQSFKIVADKLRSSI